MNIKKLELQGFKSFSDRTKLSFHHGITAIIGPNGTGKSNIVDALLWVLGGKRIKALRGERSGDVIFNGNSKVAPMGMADVKLILANKDEELSLSHRVFRSKESEYRLNGKLVRLKDIQNTLYKNAIGDSQYFVIEQGSIGLFLSSKPTEKRTLLEEAAGTAFYKDKKRLAELKLDNTEQNLIRLEDIIAEVSKAKNSLKRQANSAIRYRELREKIRELTLLFYRGKINLAEKTQHDSITSYQNYSNMEKDTQRKLKDIEKSLADKRKELWDLERANKKDQENLYFLKNQQSQLETGRERETKRIDLIEEKKKRDKEIQEELKQEIFSIEKEKKDTINNIQTLNLSLDQKLKDIQSFGRTNQTVQHKIETSQKQIEKLRADSLGNLSQLTESRNSKAKLEKELELFLRQEEKLNSNLKEEQEELKQAEKTLTRIKDEIEQENNILNEKKKSQNENIRATEKLVNSLEKLKTQHSVFETQKDKALHHIHALEQLLKKEQNAGSTVEVPASLGLLADLIESDTQYTPAVDIFWREEAKAHLVQAHDFLKALENKNPVGNFLIMGKQHKDKLLSEVFKDHRVLGRLKTKIKAHSKIKDSLSSLKDAAIVKDVKDAVELWLHHPNTNYITIKGDVLDSSGLLNLGEKKEGVFALKHEIKTLTNTIASLDEKIIPIALEIEEKLRHKQLLEHQKKESEEKLLNLEKQIDAKKKEKSYILLDKEKTETNLILIKREIGLLIRDRKSINEKLTASSLEVEGFENNDRSFRQKITEEEQSINQLQEKAANEKNEFFELRSQANLLKEKINIHKDRIQTIENRTNSISSKTNTLNLEIQDSEKQKIGLQDSLSQISNDIIKFSSQVKQKEKELALSETKLKEIQVDQAKLEDLLVKHKTKHESIKDTRIQSEIKKAEIERDVVNLEESCWQELRKTIQEVKEEVSGDIIPDDNIEEELETCKEQLQKIGNVNLMAEEEYTIQQQRYDFLTQEQKDLRESIDSTKEAISKIDKESRTQFVTALEAVNNYFKEIFTLLFEGGTAEVKLTDPNSPLESGVDIIAQPPGKRVQSLSLLSGGEKTLTSLAFFFSLFRYKPTPFCILDEVDAALDEANLSRFLNLMKKIKTQTQFIIITHNSKTMEVADYIYGTTMAEPSITSIFSVRMEKNRAG
ncbi:chromosome segregation protein SMC [Acidobacteriota bacterium]